MDSITDLAVWGSLSASLVLGAFMLVQAFMDPPRRGRFLVFAMVWWAHATLDFSYPYIDKSVYELIRLFWCGAYTGSLLWLLENRLRWILTVSVSLPLLGIFVWVSGYPHGATTVTFPWAFAIAAIAHGREYWVRRGYASAVLCAYSVAIAVMCSLYFAVHSIGNPQISMLGYAHFTEVSIISVLLGWMHLPRELRGFAPVRVDRPHAIALFIAVVASEVGIQLGLLAFYDWPPVGYVAFTVLQIVITLLFYFHHRHRLVIYTDNVTQLLEERTASLRAAQEELAHQNESQAQKLQEQARQLQAKAEVINRQRRLELAAQTAGQAAHDIQNIISPLLTYVSQLQQSASDPEAIRTLSKRINTQVERLLDLNSQMLALSRRGRLELQPTCVNELVKGLGDHFPGNLLSIESHGEAWVKGSWSQLSRALSNLVINALEAGPRRTEQVAVRCGIVEARETKRCHLGFLTPGRYAYIEVEDTGPGIPAGIREQIFEPFFSTKTGNQRSGSGLGLSIVTAIVDDHRGIIDLKTGSEGTCFTLYLPALEAPGTPPDFKKLCGNETVLVIDDDTSVLQQYEKMVEEAGYSVLTARNGYEALEILRTEQVNLLLLDLKMPRMSGFETFFGALHLQPGIHVIVHSSYISDEEATRLRQLGASALLQKPAGRFEVLSAMRQILDSQPIPVYRK